ncbi:MAG: DUF692 domain-containing protein [Pseudomonadota bacterium]
MSATVTASSVSASPVSARRPADVPAAPGVGLKAQHIAAIEADPGAVRFLEVHAENYMGAGGRPHHDLARLRERFPLSLHGVALSIGGEAPLDREHLGRLKALNARYEPGLFSEHLAWSSHSDGHDDTYLNDLLPVAYDDATLARVCDHIDQVQETVGRRMLLENPSTYIAFETSTMGEIAFLTEVVARTGCGLLLDINNVFISCANHGEDPHAYLDAFPLQAVGEIHLGGHEEQADDEGLPLLIDTHSRPVVDPVWALYARTLARTGPVPTLIEWDNDVPDWPVLAEEAARADGLLKHAASMRERGRDVAA